MGLVMSQALLYGSNLSPQASIIYPGAPAHYFASQVTTRSRYNRTGWGSVTDTHIAR